MPQSSMQFSGSGKDVQGRIYSFGLKEGGVGYIYDDRNKALIPDSIHTRVEELKQEIIAGRIKVPSTR
jgi:basic membrane protein A